MTTRHAANCRCIQHPIVILHGEMRCARCGRRIVPPVTQSLRALRGLRGVA